MKTKWHLPPGTHCELTLRAGSLQPEHALPFVGEITIEVDPEHALAVARIDTDARGLHDQLQELANWLRSRGYLPARTPLRSRPDHLAGMADELQRRHDQLDALCGTMVVTMTEPRNAELFEGLPQDWRDLVEGWKQGYDAIRKGIA